MQTTPSNAVIHVRAQVIMVTSIPSQVVLSLAVALFEFHLRQQGETREVLQVDVAVFVCVEGLQAHVRA